jgi:raffinose/stachyose/melibiose transport system permease protein
MAAPLMASIIATLGVLKFIGVWNDFLNPYIFVSNPDFRTLSTGLYLFRGQYNSNWPLYCAAVFLVAAPMIIVYVFTQRFIISGMVSGALKG